MFCGDLCELLMLYKNHHDRGYLNDDDGHCRECSVDR